MPLDSFRKPDLVVATEVAVAAINKLKEKHGELILHQSGGCCEGSTPMCFLSNEFYVDNTDILLGEIGGCKFYMNKEQYAYWRHTLLVIDVEEGYGGSFSLETQHGLRFITKSLLLN